MSNAETTGGSKSASVGPKVEVMRSQLSRARGFGAAGAHAVHHWIVARVTAIALIPLTLWFVYVVLHLLGATQIAVDQFVGYPINTVLLLALVATTFQHMQMGLSVVLQDYMTTEIWRTAAIIGVKVAAAMCGLLCAVSILHIAFTV